MRIYEIDWRIGPLRDVIVGIEAGLRSIQERLDDEGFDAVLHHTEPLLGLAFVAAQTYAVGTVADINRMRASSPMRKGACYSCDPIKVRGGVTRLQLINEVANYFKHHDEWQTWPTIKHPRSGKTVEIIQLVGITEQTEHPCIEATELLCGGRWETIVLHQIVKEWRAHMISKLV